MGVRRFAFAPALLALSSALLGAQKQSARACAPYAVDTSSWRRVQTADSAITLSLPARYKPTDDPDEWRSSIGELVRVYVIDLWRLRDLDRESWMRDTTRLPVFSVAEMLLRPWNPAGDEVLRGGDALSVREHSACRVALDGVPALFEAGLVSGGFVNVTDEPRVLVHFWPNRRDVVVFDGTAVNLAGQRELLRIARRLDVSVVRARKLPPRRP